MKILHLFNLRPPYDNINRQDLIFFISLFLRQKKISFHFKPTSTKIMIAKKKVPAKNRKIFLRHFDDRWSFFLGPPKMLWIYFWGSMFFLVFMFASCIIRSCQRTVMPSRPRTRCFARVVPMHEIPIFFPSPPSLRRWWQEWWMLPVESELMSEYV